jgi:hypothetical protein
MNFAGGCCVASGGSVEDAGGSWRPEVLVPSLEPDAKSTHCATFTATFANMIVDYESESLGPMYGFIRQNLLRVATST